MSSPAKKSVRLITVAGPHSCGKTSVILRTIEPLIASGLKIGVVKFDCLTSEDHHRYSDAGISAKKGLAGGLCPDHFFIAMGITVPRGRVRLGEFLTSIPTDHLMEFSLDHQALTDQCLDFIGHMEKFSSQRQRTIDEVTIKAGRDKSGRPELNDVVLRGGEVVAVVGPTGSGKRRLLADIECLAQRDTPSGRRCCSTEMLPIKKSVCQETSSWLPSCDKT